MNDFDDIEIKEITAEPKDSDLIIKIGKDAQRGNKGAKMRFFAMLSIALFIVALVCGGIYVKMRIDEMKKQEEFESLAQASEAAASEEKTVKTPKKEPVVVSENEVEEEEDDPFAGIPDLSGFDLPDKSLDFTTLKEQNEDIYSWIYIPGTKIDYPVLQDPDDINYYLDHNLDGSSGLPGCIYTQNYNKLDYSDMNTVLYGHNMKNGTMFAGLHKFRDEQYFNDNRYIYIYTDDGHTLVYEIFGAYEYSDDHILYEHDYTRPAEYEEYLTSVFDQKDKLGNNFSDDININTSSMIITLETCISTKPTRRFIVQGVLVGRE